MKSRLSTEGGWTNAADIKRAEKEKTEDMDPEKR